MPRDRNFCPHGRLEHEKSRGNFLLKKLCFLEVWQAYNRYEHIRKCLAQLFILYHHPNKCDLHLNPFPRGSNSQKFRNINKSHTWENSETGIEDKDRMAAYGDALGTNWKPPPCKEELITLLWSLVSHTGNLGRFLAMVYFCRLPSTVARMGITWSVSQGHIAKIRFSSIKRGRFSQGKIDTLSHQKRRYALGKRFTWSPYELPSRVEGKNKS